MGITSLRTYISLKSFGTYLEYLLVNIVGDGGSDISIGRYIKVKQDAGIAQQRYR